MMTDAVKGYQGRQAGSAPLAAGLKLDRAINKNKPSIAGEPGAQTVAQRYD